IALVVLRSGAQIERFLLETEIIQSVREQIGPVAALKTVTIVDRLPKTRSGKILRKLLRAIADGNTYAIPSTIDDPLIIDEIVTTFKEHRIGNISA
ncbi:MAG: propionyl-CoA synthetase, partial [Bacteroidota bacterium]|nr:propionyl-CoA synthetase [Bacteroidota bacterium]